MNLYIVFEKESGAAVSTRYVDAADKEILNVLHIAAGEYDPYNLGFDSNICDITEPLEMSRTQAAELFGRVIIDIDPVTKQLRDI
jgi:hypothetical protein